MPVHNISTNNRRQLGQTFKKMNADDDLSTSERFDLHISNQTVKDIMGPTPIPSLMIEIDEITDQF